MTKPITATCPSCRKQLRTKKEFVGKNVRCPKCRNPFVIQANATTADSSQSKVTRKSKVKSTSPQRKAGAPSPRKRSKPASSKEPRNKSVMIGLGSLAVVLLLILGYFGLQSLSPKTTKVTENAVAEGSAKTPVKTTLSTAAEQQGTGPKKTTMTDVEQQATPEMDADDSLSAFKKAPNQENGRDLELAWERLAEFNPSASDTLLEKIRQLPAQSINELGPKLIAKIPGIYTPRPITPEFNGPTSLDDVELNNFPTYAAAADKEGLAKLYEEQKAWLIKHGNSKCLLLVGRVEIEDANASGLVNSQQVNIRPDGTFIHMTSNRKTPVPLRAHGYEQVDIQLTGCQGAAVDIGTIRMKRLPPSTLRNLKGEIALADSGDLSTVSVKIHINCGPYNSRRGVRQAKEAISVPLASDGTFKMKGFSPANYLCDVRAPGYVYQRVPIDFTGEESPILQIKLEKPLSVQLEYTVAEDSQLAIPFELASKEKEVLSADGRSWEFPDGQHPIRLMQKDGKLKFRSTFSDTEIKDLGPGRLKDFIDVKKATDGMSGYASVENGHVYLIRHEYGKLYILVQVSGYEQQDAKDIQPPTVKMKAPAETVSRSNNQKPSTTATKKSANQSLESKKGKLQKPTKSDFSIIDKFQGKVLGASFYFPPDSKDRDYYPMFNLYLSGSEAEKAEGFGFIESFTATSGGKPFGIENRDLLKNSWLSLKRIGKGYSDPIQNALGIPEDARRINFFAGIAKGYETMPDHIEKVSGNVCLFVPVKSHDIVVENFMSYMGKELDHPELKKAGMQLSFSLKDFNIPANNGRPAFKARQVHVNWDTPGLSKTEIRLTACGLKPGPCSLDVLSRSDEVLSMVGGSFLAGSTVARRSNLGGAERPAKNARCVLTFDPDFKIPSDAKLRIRFVSEVKIVEVPFSLENVPVYIGEMPKSEFDAKKNKTD